LAFPAKSALCARAVLQSSCDTSESLPSDMSPATLFAGSDEEDGAVVKCSGSSIISPCIHYAIVLNNVGDEALQLYMDERQNTFVNQSNQIFLRLQQEISILLLYFRLQLSTSYYYWCIWCGGYWNMRDSTYSCRRCHIIEQ